MSIRAVVISSVLYLCASANLCANANAATIVAFGDSNTAQAWSWQYYVAQQVPGYQGAAFWNPVSSTSLMITRVNQALGSMSAQQIAENYFVIDGGGGDMLSSLTGYGQTLNNFDTMVGLLTNAGAQHIVVMNIFDIMALPVSDAANNPNGAAVHNWIDTVNSGLATRYASNANVAVFDLHSIIDAVLLDPSHYGISPGICVLGCIFADNTHFGAGVHRVIGDEFIAAEMSAVPVPATAWLFGSGVVGLLGAMRRRAKAIEIKWD